MSRVARTTLAAAFACALVFAGNGARADEQAEFEKARAAFQAHAYQDAEARFTALLDPKAKEKLEPALVSQARMYLGAAYLLDHRTDDAVAIFKRLLVDDPRFDPDPLTFPTEVLNTFIDARAEIREDLNKAAAYAARLEAEKRAREELEKKRQAERLHILEQMAAEEKITVRHTRLAATVPFGVGQFQNGQRTAGWIFLGVESALVVASLVTFPIYVEARNRQTDETNEGDTDKKAALYKNRADATQIANWGIVGALGLVMIGGIVQAHVAFVPETEDNKVRPIPQAKNKIPFALVPLFSGTPKTESSPASGFLGVKGTF